MGIKVFWVGCADEFYIELAKKMQKLYGWNPIAWSATSLLRSQIIKSFPDINFFDFIDAAKGRYEVAGCQVTADGLFLQKHAEHMLIAIEQMDRMDPMNAFSFQERWDLFRGLVNYWQAKFEQLSPDLVFFSLPPHMIYDYVIYMLCEINSIPTTTWMHTSLPGRILVTHNHKSDCNYLKDTYQNKLNDIKNGKLILSEFAEQYYKKIRGSYEEGLPNYIVELNNKLSSTGTPKTFHELIINYAHPKSIYFKAKAAISEIRKPVPLNYIKQPGKSIQDSELNKGQFKTYKSRSNRRKINLFDSYQKLAERPVAKEKSIFFALHYQPEMTTNPLGGVFTDQLMALEMLAANLPEGWKLYVKEAPLSFMPLYRLAYHRNMAYYEKIKNMPGTKLIAMEHSSFELIDHCQATATITGTVGWESVIRGKPSIVFGHAWYKDCEGIYRVNSNSDLHEFMINLMNNKLSVNQDMVRAYLSALDESGIKGYMERNKRVDDQVTEKDNLDNLSKALADFYKKYISNFVASDGSSKYMIS